MKRICTLVVAALVMITASTAQAQVKKKSPVKKATTVVKPKTAQVKETAPAEQFTRVKITTSMGDIVVKLYNKTPQHRDNFIKLVKDHFYDSLLFHRVIKGFMIQGGDPDSKNAAAGVQLGRGGLPYTIPAEFDTTLIHKKGALCAARTNNPEKASSSCQFYIVQGHPISDGELDFHQNNKHIRYSNAQRMTYKMKGGTPQLDMDYTVFGEVVSGLEVIDKIAAVATDGANRPLEDVRMQMTLIEQ